MSEIPGDLRADLENRVREQIASEARGDVSSLYDFTLPAIRAGRIAERGDEPELSLSQIRKFVQLVHEAEVLSIHVDRFVPSLERYSGAPAARVVTRVRYNRSSHVSEFRCIWVYSNGVWFTTSLGKIRWGCSKDSSVGGNSP
jgi:hypothetical protein